MTDYIARTKKVLEQIHYATIATSSKDGKPWNSPVAHVYDDDLNIYWFSDKEGQHSRNVRENGNVFIVIYDSTIPEGQGEGVYIEAKASEINDPDEITRVRRIKKGQDYDRPADDFLGDAVRRVYKAVPERAWMNDAEIKDGVFIRDYRVEVPLNKLKDLLA
jgi:nitroimidazol reductase NimA-like FMN-containing flavoprotein (pyridoxamine 5'-phosphate oxidase superfamily)